MQEPVTQAEGPYASAAAHPEEMRAGMEFRFGNTVSLSVTARTTPAGLIATGVMVAGILLSVTALVRAIRRPG